MWQCFRLLFDDLVRKFSVGLSLERRLQAREIIHRNAYLPYVCLIIVRLVLNLLRRKIQRRSSLSRFLPGISAHLLLYCLTGTKITNFACFTALHQKDILTFDISVHHILHMQVLDSLKDLESH